MEVLLIKRANEPFKEMWALPGGFVDMGETVEQAVVRELEEETSLSGIELKQFHTFSAVDRDPRHRTVSVVFMGLADNSAEPIAADDAKDAKWFNIDDLPELGFDHAEILEKVLYDRKTIFLK